MGTTRLAARPRNGLTVLLSAALLGGCALGPDEGTGPACADAKCDAFLERRRATDERPRGAAADFDLDAAKALYYTDCYPFDRFAAFRAFCTDLASAYDEAFVDRLYAPTPAGPVSDADKIVRTEVVLARAWLSDDPARSLAHVCDPRRGAPRRCDMLRRGAVVAGRERTKLSGATVVERLGEPPAAGSPAHGYYAGCFPFERHRGAECDDLLAEWADASFYEDLEAAHHHPASAFDAEIVCADLATELEARILTTVAPSCDAAIEGTTEATCDYHVRSVLFSLQNLSYLGCDVTGLFGGVLRRIGPDPGF